MFSSAKKAAGGMEDQVKGIVEGEMEKITKRLEDIENNVDEMVSKSVGEVKESIEKVVDTLKGQVEGAMEEIKDLKDQMGAVTRLISCLQCFCCCCFPSSSSAPKKEAESKP